MSAWCVVGGCACERITLVSLSYSRSLLPLVFVSCHYYHVPSLKNLSSQVIFLPCISLVPRPLPDLSRSRREKLGEGLGSKLCNTTSRTGNGGLGKYVTWTRVHNCWSVMYFDPRPSPDFSPRLRDKI